MSYAPPPLWQGPFPGPTPAGDFAPAAVLPDEPRRPPIGPLATAVMLPLSCAVGGALIVNGRHRAAGLAFKPTVPHFWQTVWEVAAYGVVLALGFAVTAVVVRTWWGRAGQRRVGRIWLALAAGAVLAGASAWGTCRPKAAYRAGLEDAYAGIDAPRLVAECETMPALLATAGITTPARDSMKLFAGEPAYAADWARLPPYVRSLNPQQVTISPEGVTLVMDPAFIEIRHAESGLFIPVTPNAAATARGGPMRPLSASATVYRFGRI